MPAKCPNCKQELPYVNGEPVEVKPPTYPRNYKAVVYSCPSCQFFLGVQIDPIALQTSLLEALDRKVAGE